MSINWPTVKLSEGQTKEREVQIQRILKFQNKRAGQNVNL